MSLLPTAAGHPPRLTKKAISSRLEGFAAADGGTPSNRAHKETSPVESPDSNRLIVRIFNLLILPAPEWETLERSGGVEEPVKTNCENVWRLSTSKRTASHSFGATCHSSTRRGVAPASRACGSISESSKLRVLVFGSCMKSALAHSCDAVVVLPHHFGPSTRVAPFACSFSASKESYIRLKYFTASPTC